ncbi:NUDIX hydrolase [Thermohalobacter berrensis]|uniref:ADP-ribose pyrophosphatase n=1 Tax=Thermohalobacter berrensis TaxID=99594 RepID=A0A419TAR1_9FIRM|nr:NUDIX hydrolase [Thermohalobacter berrensis]RKD34553.1 ADP-ribose pyrophosphatase [Thermohalobacter berrensis]
MSFEEKTMKTEKIYDGKILKLRIDTVELPDKKYSKREIVEHPGAVGIVPITENNEVVLVKQYRKAVEKVLYEIPAGKLEIGEEPLNCAVRELKEETGIIADKMEFISEFYTTPGFCDEKIYLFIAQGLEEGKANPDNDEYIDVVKLKINEVLSMINDGVILDSKTIIGILMAKRVLEGEK